MINTKAAPIAAEKIKVEVLEGFKRGYNCAEAIFTPFAAALGADPSLMRIATPFGAGIGGRRDLCGILTGGVMIIGLLAGREGVDDVEQKARAYKLAARYYRWFRTEQKLHCAEIVTGRFTGHTEDCVRLMESAQAELTSMINDIGKDE